MYIQTDLSFMFLSLADPMVFYHFGKGWNHPQDGPRFQVIWRMGTRHEMEGLLNRNRTQAELEWDLGLPMRLENLPLLVRTALRCSNSVEKQ